MLSSPEHLLSDHCLSNFHTLLNSFQINWYTSTGGGFYPGRFFFFGGGGGSMRGELFAAKPGKFYLSTPLGMTGKRELGFSSRSFKIKNCKELKKKRLYSTLENRHIIV